MTAAVDAAARQRRIRTDDGLELALTIWPARQATPRWTFVVAHGLGEHAGRYQGFSEWFCARGAEVYAADHRGHGRSGGPRGDSPSLSALVDDLDRVVTFAHPPPGRPLVLIGHSMGGAIAIAYALAHPERIERAVFSAPALRVKQRVPPWMALLGRVMPVVWPTLTLGSGLNTALLSRDPQVVEAYRHDPLVHDRISARLYRETIGRGKDLIALAPQLRTPFLLLHGEADGLIDPRGSAQFFRRATGGLGTYRSYPGLYHEIFNEPEREQVFADILDWLERPPR